MPELLPVQSILFQNLLRDFQIIAPPRVPVWWMSDIIQPVAIVNSQVTLTATVDERAMLFATNGAVLVPAAGAILADTGGLDVGTYLFRIYVSLLETANQARVSIQHRDAADAANIWPFEVFGHSTTHRVNFYTMEWTEAMAQDERMRIVNDVLGGANSRYNAIIWRSLIS